MVLEDSLRGGQARSKEHVPLLPLAVSHPPKCVSYVLMGPIVGVVIMGKITELVRLNKDSLWLSR